MAKKAAKTKRRPRGSLKPVILEDLRAGLSVKQIAAKRRCKTTYVYSVRKSLKPDVKPIEKTRQSAKLAVKMAPAAIEVNQIVRVTFRWDLKRLPKLLQDLEDKNIRDINIQM